MRSLMLATLLSTLTLPLTLHTQPLYAQGLSGTVEPGSAAHQAQIERFRSPTPTASRLVKADEGFLPLPSTPADFSGLRYEINGQSFSLDDYMTQTHVSGLLVLKDGNILLERYGLEDRARAYGSYEEVLADPEVDAVYVPLPTTLHVRWVRLAAEAGKAVLLEKPIALTAAATDEVVGACREAGVQLMDGARPRSAAQRQAGAAQGRCSAAQS